MASIGTKIREIRLTRGLTLEKVSTDTGLSLSFLSMVERDKASISVDNLEKLARYYQVHIVQFFQADAAPVVITRRQDLEKGFAAINMGPAAVALLSNNPDARMEPMLIRISPGQEEPHFRQHSADTLLYVIQGSVRLIAESGEEERLEQGDAAYYVNLPHHRIANPSQTEPLLVLAVTSPKTSTLDELLQARRGQWMSKQ